jgi:glycosyltransferase involved in cell wall biosynthesis
MLRSSRQVICVSQCAADQFAAFPLRRRAQVIYDGLDLERITYLPGREQARQTFGLPSDALVVGTMGYLNPRKGADLLIEALALVKTAYPGRVLALIAGEPYRGHAAYAEHLRTRALALGLTPDVLFTGFLPDVARFFAAIDLFALPTHEPEGFGGTLLEAAAAGLPAIASGLGGAREVIADGVTGLLIPPGSSAALAEAVLTLGCDPARRHDLGAAALRRVITHFSLERTVNQTLQLYQSLVEQARGGSALSELAHPTHVRSLPHVGSPGT